jgi:DDE superfamily endonuclease
MPIPEDMVAIVAAFAPLFSARVWDHAQVLIWGTLLARGPRTVTAALRAMGRGDEQHWTNFHRVVNRATWSALAAAGTLLMLVLRLVPGAHVVVAIDDLLERRGGTRIGGRGVYRDPLTSSRAHQSKSAGLRWVVASVLVALPWSERVWALPVVSVLAPPPPLSTRKSKAAKAAKAAGKKYLPPRRKRTRPRVALTSEMVSTVDRPRQGVRRHKTTVDVAGQILSWLGRHAAGHRVVAVLDGAFSAHKLLRGAARRKATLVTRLHWDAQLYEMPTPGSGATLGARAASPRQRIGALATPWREARVRWYGGRRKTVFVTSFVALWTKGHAKPVPVRVVLSLDPSPDSGKPREECFVCTDPEASPEQVVAWFVLRWNEEVTFEESRRHLGIQTQRQWSTKAIARTTPVLLGLFSLVTLMTAALVKDGKVPIRSAPWYDKQQATFSDCLALVRRQLWRARLFPAPHPDRGAESLTPDVMEAILEALPLIA